MSAMLLAFQESRELTVGNTIHLQTRSIDRYFDGSINVSGWETNSVVTIPSIDDKKPTQFLRFLGYLKGEL